MSDIHSKCQRLELFMSIEAFFKQFATRLGRQASPAAQHHLSFAELEKISLEVTRDARAKKSLKDAAQVLISSIPLWQAEWLNYHSTFLRALATTSSHWEQVLATRKAIIACSHTIISAVPYLFDDFTEKDKQTLVAYFHPGDKTEDLIRREKQRFCFAEASCSCLVAIACRLGDVEDDWRGVYCKMYDQFIQNLYRSKIASSRGEADPFLELLTAASYKVVDKLATQILAYDSIHPSAFVA